MKVSLSTNYKVFQNVDVPAGYVQQLQSMGFTVEPRESGGSNWLYVEPAYVSYELSSLEDLFLLSKNMDTAITIDYDPVDEECVVVI